MEDACDSWLHLVHCLVLLLVWCRLSASLRSLLHHALSFHLLHICVQATASRWDAQRRADADRAVQQALDNWQAIQQQQRQQQQEQWLEDIPHDHEAELWNAQQHSAMPMELDLQPQQQQQDEQGRQQQKQQQQQQQRDFQS
jgi:hypothetical protein